MVVQTPVQALSPKWNRPWFSSLALACCLLAAACLTLRAAPLRIYIVTDLEGASGVYQFAQTREPGPLNEKAKEYLMADIAAVVRGLRAAKVTDIIVLDGHGAGAFIPHLMEPGAKYITGKPRPGPFLCGLDESFAGLIQVGAHAMMGTPDGVLCHTQSSRTEHRYWYNGVESGELAQCAALAGHFGVPTIMVTGDEAACRESEKFFGANCVTVAVKRGISREAAALYPFAETSQALYEGARRAVAATPRCQPYKLALPIQARKEYLVFDTPSAPGRHVTKEATIEDARKVVDF